MKHNQSNALHLAQWFSDNQFYSASVLKNGEKIFSAAKEKALNLFHRASLEVPAYKDFLQKHTISPSSITSFSDLMHVPQTTKENYINNYTMQERAWNGNLDGLHIISTSSGTTGTPYFWPRNLQAEIEGAYLHEFIFRENFQMDKKQTLFLNGFPMGNWIAGTFTFASVNLVAWKGYPITSMIPGYSIEPVVELLKTVSPEFEQTVLIGHTPFLKEVIEVAVKENIDFKKLKIKLLGTGQAITENWRDYITGLIQSDSSSMINLYGSADCALMGFETPFSIDIRKLLSQNLNKSKQLFGDGRLPSLYQFDPRLTFFEEEKGELLITKDTGCPLIRYNIHDIGGVISYRSVKSHLRDLQNTEKNETEMFQYQLPFVYLFGREKFMVKIYGANVYSEHVQHALNHIVLQPFLTGRYILEMGYDEKQNPQMICRVELSLGTKKTNDFLNIIKKTFINEIRNINSEYNYVLEEVGNKAEPVIILHEHGDVYYFPKEKIKKTA